MTNRRSIALVAASTMALTPLLSAQTDSTRAQIPPPNTLGIGVSRPASIPMPAAPRVSPTPAPAAPVTWAPARTRFQPYDPGLTVDARYRGRKWDIGLHLGGGVGGGMGGGEPTTPTCPPDQGEGCPSPRPIVIVRPYPYTLGWGGLWGSYAFHHSYVVEGSSLSLARPAPTPGMTLPDSPAASTAAPAEPLSDLDAGRAALRQGQTSLALTKLRAYANAHPDDAPARRVLALALLDSNRFDDALAVMRAAYASDPRLAGEPLDPTDFGGDASFREWVVQAVRHAHRVDSAGSWLLVAVLMQAEQRPEPARWMLAKARERGLESPVADALAAALQTP